jgi:hypothetical protein
MCPVLSCSMQSLLPCDRCGCLLCIADTACKAECSNTFQVVDTTAPTITGTRPAIEGSPVSISRSFAAAPTLVTLW